MKSLYKVALKEETSSKSQWGKMDKDEKPSGMGTNTYNNINKSMSRSLRKSMRSVKSSGAGSASDSVDSQNEDFEVDS